MARAIEGNGVNRPRQKPLALSARRLNGRSRAAHGFDARSPVFVQRKAIQAVIGRT